MYRGTGTRADLRRRVGELEAEAELAGPVRKWKKQSVEVCHVRTVKWVPQPREEEAPAKEEEPADSENGGDGEHAEQGSAPGDHAEMPREGQAGGLAEGHDPKKESVPEVDGPAEQGVEAGAEVPGEGAMNGVVEDGKEDGQLQGENEEPVAKVEDVEDAMEATANDADVGPAENGAPSEEIAPNGETKTDEADVQGDALKEENVEQEDGKNAEVYPSPQDPEGSPDQVADTEPSAVPLNESSQDEIEDGEEEEGEVK